MIALAFEKRFDYVFFSDQDDVWLNDKISSSMEKIRSLEMVYGKNTPLLVFGDSVVVDEGLQELASSFWEYENLDSDFCNKFNNILLQNVAQGCTMVFNLALLEKSGVIPNAIVMHDWWLILVASAFGKVDYLDKPLLLYRQHDTNEVGSRKMSIFSAISKFIYQRDSIVRSIQNSKIQAGVFVECFGDQLPSDILVLAKEYSLLDEKTWLKRKVFCLKNKLRKTSTLRTLGFYIFV